MNIYIFFCKLVASDVQIILVFRISKTRIHKFAFNVWLLYTIHINAQAMVFFFHFFADIQKCFRVNYDQLK